MKARKVTALGLLFEVWIVIVVLLIIALWNQKPAP